MLTAKQFEGLKKANLSIDAQKSRERISEGYKSASSEVKKAIHALSGLTQNTFYNAFQKGTASPKMVLAMAQLLGVSPYYYIGETDKKDSFNDETLKKFLAEKKLAVIKKAGRPAKKVAVAKVKVEKPVKPVKKGRKAAVKAVPAPKAVPKKAASVPKAAKTPAAKAAPADNEVFIQVSIPKSPKLQRAIANLDEESAVLLLRALIRKTDASDQAKALCDIIKSCLLS
ncbi:MAG: hypothetical protein LBC86_07115 [Oscillospiraceae bacterium]|jgi:septum formation inhibitor MinC|nr:hypothetical protein [Oscillospiraceae bacterium]